MNKKNDKKDGDEEIQRQLRLINVLATRLPWIAVVMVFISLLFILLEVFLRHKPQ